MKQNKLSPTNQKVIDLLRRTQKPMSAYDILAKLGRYGLRAPPTVYRALDQLMKQGMVHKIESLNAFAACCNHEGHAGISQFAICDNCGTAEELKDETLTRAIAKSKPEFLQQIHHQTLEISGLCHGCARVA
jgi:Fur family zinc uptake transcriptional regulator